MTVYDMIKDYILNGGLILILLLTLVQIVPIKINPWSKIANCIGRALNQDMKKELEEVKQDVKDCNHQIDKLNYEFHENSAMEWRVRILRFGDEVSHGQNHSRDHFQQIMVDITNYNRYCDEHPTFLNNMTTITVKRIEEDYAERDRKNNFL